MAYDIIQAEPGAGDYTPYGAAREFVNYRGPEAVISGPAETGKTLAALWKLHCCASKYAGASIVIARKTLTSTYSTVLVTFQKKVLAPLLGGGDIVAYGGEKPQWFDYPNGSRIWVAGLDKSSRVLSSEHDLIYVNQVEELTLDDWETLTTRATGRAGNMPYAQTIGDMNPAWPGHWIYSRQALKMFYSWHTENPVLYDQATGEITEQGKRTMAVLQALTGVRRVRLLEGKPAQAEGAIFTEWNEGIHLIDPFDIPKGWRRFRSIDFGYVNPFTCQWWAVDPDGVMYLYRQLYYTGRTVRVHSQQIKEFSQGENIEATICDHDAEDRATLAEEGIPNRPANKAVSVGLGKVKDRLRGGPGGKPRLYVMRDSLIEVDPSLRERRLPMELKDEIPGYVWSSKKQESPVKEHDHGCDAMRYAVMYIDSGGSFMWGIA